MFGIGFIIGFVLASILYYKSDDWRVRRLREQGYDCAVRDITEFGYYYDKNNERVNVSIKIEDK